MSHWQIATLRRSACVKIKITELKIKKLWKCSFLIHTIYLSPIKMCTILVKFSHAPQKVHSRTFTKQDRVRKYTRIKHLPPAQNFTEMWKIFFSSGCKRLSHSPYIKNAQKESMSMKGPTQINSWTLFVAWHSHRHKVFLPQFWKQHRRGNGQGRKRMGKLQQNKQICTKWTLN